MVKLAPGTSIVVKVSSSEALALGTARQTNANALSIRLQQLALVPAGLEFIFFMDMCSPFLALRPERILETANAELEYGPP
jgi:hypothetical protein